MKKILTLILLGTAFLSNAQAYKGKGDTKANIGLTIVNGGTGIQASGDYGLGENFSIGLLSSYLLGGTNIDLVKFEYRFDLKARFNANLSNVLDVSPKLDVYPGLNLGLKNFGGHLGVRYFFTDGFGVFTEVSTPFANYDKKAATKFNNSTTFSIGASFNL